MSDDWAQRLTAQRRRLERARAREHAERDATRQLAIEAIDAGQPEAWVARQLGITRTAIRDWQGKRR